MTLNFQKVNKFMYVCLSEVNMHAHLYLKGPFVCSECTSCSYFKACLHACIH